MDWLFLKRSIISGLSEKERKILDEWLEESPAHRDLYRDMNRFWSDRESFRPGIEQIRRFRMAYEKQLNEADRKRSVRRLLIRVSVAASCLIAFGVAAWVSLIQESDRKERLLSDAGKESVIRPGAPQAILVTQGGKTVNLNAEVPAVEIAGGVELKNQGNALLYDDTLLNTVGTEENQLIVPRGGEYSIVLSDGTRVWLNSASELKYPVRFTGNVRRVYLKGEAYFEVAHDRNKAFFVMTDEVEVKVYGTEFNVNTRAGGCVQTTLIDGSVSVRNDGTGEWMLRPDQMAEYNPENGKIDVRKVDVTNYISWKSGVYVFENRTVEQIMDELALWYDVEVFFRNNASRTRCFSGSLPRYRNIGEMLSVIEKTTHVRFEVKGRTVVVN